jgi:transposase
MNEPLGFLPEARRTGVIRKEVDGELLVYDLTRDKAHCLNESAAAIWKRCDARTSIKEIAASLAKEVGATVDERVVWLALADLRRTHLLEEPRNENHKSAKDNVEGTSRAGLVGGEESGVEPPHSKRGQWPQVMLGMSRREAVKRIGLGAAIALPVVISITAPTPAQALSCVQAGGACSTTPQCCENLMCSTDTNKCE